jgi:uncharacterized integral membrane protein
VRNNDLEIFKLLKQKIVLQMQKSFPGINPDISAWKGQDIIDFQEELLAKVNANISEKWFYSHFKSQNISLPRIDMLNLLSKYAGFANWDDFRFKQSNHPGKVQPVIKNPNRFFIIVPALMILILAFLFVFFKVFNTREYTFNFFDADTKMPVTNSIIEVSVILDGESPVSHLCRPDGSFQIKTDKSNIRFVVKSPYYQTDTIFRKLDKFNRNETVKLRSDNYALMLLYFSTMNVKDWQKRRNQLDAMISDSAMIYQVYASDEIGLELYNKWEFINKLTLPASSLQGIEILDTKYQGDQISLIRFRQKEVTK